MKYLALIFLMMAFAPVPAMAAPDAARQHALEHAARSFSSWKLEAYRRRDVAAHFHMEDSVFHDSLLGYRTDSVSAERRDPEPLRNWQRCPAGYRSAAFVVTIELPASAPAGLEIQLLNRKHELICSRSLDALHAGRTDIEFTLEDQPDVPTDTNPSEILLQYNEQWQGLSITAIRVLGHCGKLGQHEFGRFELSGVSLATARKLILF